MPGWDKERYARDEEYRARLCGHSRKYYQAHKHDIACSSRTKRLQKHYGLSEEEYDALLAKQSGACAICRRRPKGRLCVDHCHLTGMVRGLLCRKCNLGLGCLVDDAASLISAFAYLAYRMTEGDKAGTAAQRALVARAMLRAPPTRTTARTMARRNEPMRKALEAELSRENILREIVRKLTVEALDGNLDAIKEIFDRVDDGPVEDAAGGKTSVSMTLD
jgi:Autographiviridae endonuclease VII